MLEPQEGHFGGWFGVTGLPEVYASGGWASMEAGPTVSDPVGRITAATEIGTPGRPRGQLHARRARGWGLPMVHREGPERGSAGLPPPVPGRYLSVVLSWASGSWRSLRGRGRPPC